MKSFEQFRKDLSEMDRSIAVPGLVGAGLRGMINVASGPLKKGVKAVTSTISAIDDLNKKREENRKKRDAANDALKKVPVSYTHLTLPTNREV